MQNSDKEYGESCVKILRKIERGEIKAATSALVIVELANALRKYGLSREVKAVADAIFSLGIQVLEVDPVDDRIAHEFLMNLK